MKAEREKFRTIFKERLARRQGVIVDDDALILSREKLVAAREDAGQLRAADAENVAHVRAGRSCHASRVSVTDYLDLLC